MKDGIYNKIKQSVREIPFSDRYKYLNGSEVAAIVKYYKGYDFATYTTFNFIHSVKKWTPEQRQLFSDKQSEKNGFLFEIGKDFENKMASVFSDLDNIVDIKDFSCAETSFANDDLRISATPDFLLTTNSGSINLVETKAGSNTSPYLTAYKYQVAIQSLLIPDFDINAKNTQIKIYFGSDLKKAKLDKVPYKSYTCDKQEILRMQEEIIECSKRFWTDNESNNFTFVGFEDAMSVFDEKKTFAEIDEKSIDIFEHLCNLKGIISMLEEEVKTVSNAFLEKYIDYNSVQFGVCDKKISIVKSKSVVIDKVSIKADIKKHQRKLAELRQLAKDVKDGNMLKEEKKPYIMIK